jgi:hypothetical protein
MKKPTPKMKDMQKQLMRLKGDAVFAMFGGYMDLYTRQLIEDYESVTADRLLHLQGRIKGVRECAHFLDTLK